MTTGSEFWVARDNWFSVLSNPDSAIASPTTIIAKPSFQSRVKMSLAVLEQRFSAQGPDGLLKSATTRGISAHNRPQSLTRQRQDEA